MRNYKCYGTKSGRMPMSMPDPADFGDSKKDASGGYAQPENGSDFKELDGEDAQLPF